MESDNELFSQDNEKVIELEQIVKAFGGVKALDGVDFELKRGEIHALLGENGAGKSTLIKIIAGAIKPDDGTYTLKGKKVVFSSPHEAMSEGVSVVYQETSLAPDLSVLENLYLGTWAGSQLKINWKEMRRKAKQLLEELGMNLPLNARVNTLGKGNAQQVEIARAILRKTDILILDEPGSVLNDDELNDLHALIKRYVSDGVAVIYITHRLEEVEKIADRISVLRDGKRVAFTQASGVSKDWMVSKMVGRPASTTFTRDKIEPGETVLSLSNVCCEKMLKDISFDVHKREVLGVAGLVGCGKTELAELICGYRKIDSGVISFLGEKLNDRPVGVRSQGISYLPGDRSGKGVFDIMTLSSNMTMPSLKCFRKFFWIDGKERDKYVSQRLRDLGVNKTDPKVQIFSLSGGNQQKVLLGRCLELSPKLLILEDPTSGVDVAAKREIHMMIDSLVSNGCAVLLISSDLNEIMTMSDRILVMREGKISGEKPRDADAEEIMALAF